jgi:hypothetical protein
MIDAIIIVLLVLQLILTCVALVIVNGISQELDALKDELYEGHYRPGVR